MKDMGIMKSHGESSGDMDARLWINLAMVYAKLPVRDFCRLRLVCKDWNRLASDRRFLEETFGEHIAKSICFATLLTKLLLLLGIPPW
ncbi:hypothetical protein M758_2G064000 [Ceratodon purpureus]|nr:hypothetical protein M758_2G064000 [Ceratodon purpureus]